MFMLDDVDGFHVPRTRERYFIRFFLLMYFWEETPTTP